MILSSGSFRIVILEDNLFYNQLFANRLRLFMETLLQETGHEFTIESYTRAGECVANLKEDTDVLFVDFYLNDSLTALDVVRQMRWKCPDASIYILSQYYSLTNSMSTVLEGATGFIQKGLSAIPKSCSIVEQTIHSRLYS